MSFKEWAKGRPVGEPGTMGYMMAESAWDASVVAARGGSYSTEVLAADSSTKSFEYEACMRAMDAAGVPRTDSTFGAVYSIWGRAQWMVANGG